ncbi:MAG: SPFH domain-containing protein [Armatimonadetes bacterium]|nr:SPFH domain-containing protein [Armatimonadota bacterium]
MKRFKLTRILFGAGVCLVLFLIGFGIYNSFMRWIPAGHVGLLYRANGGLEKRIYRPQRIFVGWMTTLYTYPTKEQAAIYTNDTEEGEVKSADAVKVTTNDNANTDFDIVVWYHIAPDDVLKVFDNHRGQAIELIQSSVIRSAVRQAASNIGTQYDAFALMGEARGEASVKLTALLQQELGQRGITIDSAEFAGHSPSPAILTRITSQINAETDLNIAKTHQEVAKAKKIIAITLATAQAEASRLKSAQTQAKSLELLNIEADIAALKKWDGKVPPIQTRQGQSIVITPETLNAITGKDSNR